MAGSYNKIILIGNLGRDPEARMLPSGDPVATFSVATTERNKTGDVTTWFRVSAFGKLAETCQTYLHKGSYVYIEGALAQSEYTNREGQVRQSLEVRAREMRMLDKVGDRADVGEEAGQPAQSQGGRDAWTEPRQSAPASDDMGDVPF